MAQLKDTLIQGSARVTDTLYTNAIQTQILHAPTSASGTTFGAGTNGQVLRTNGTSIYWSAAPATGVTSVQVQASSPLSSSVNTAQTSTLNTTISFATQAHNTVLAGPASTSAANAAPTFRSLTADDIPTLTASKVGLGNVSNAAQITKATFTEGYQIMYSTAASTPAVLTANKSTTKKFLTMTGASSSAGAAPAWSTIAAEDLPNATTTTKGAIVVGTGLTISTATVSISGMDTTNGSTTKCLTEKGTWASFSASDTKVTQAYGTTNSNYPLLMSATAGISSTSSRGATTAILNNTIYANPSSGELYATKVYNAVWNDYAEYRKTLEKVKPGQVVVDNDDGSMSIANKRLMSGAQVVSDTWGHIMGKTEEAKTPIAVAGRVLVYTYQDRKNYHAGQVVCSAPNGTVDIMTRQEIKDYPDAIIGIVSEIPEYLYWGTDNVLVDNRIWIKIR